MRYDFYYEGSIGKYLESELLVYPKYSDFSLTIGDNTKIYYAEDTKKYYQWGFLGKKDYCEFSAKIDTANLDEFPPMGLEEYLYFAENTKICYKWGDISKIVYWVTKKPQIDFPTRADFPLEGIIDTVYYTVDTHLYYTWKYHIDKFDYTAINPVTYDWGIALYLDGNKVADYAVLFFADFAQDINNPQNLRTIAAGTAESKDYSAALPIMGWLRYNLV